MICWIKLFSVASVHWKFFKTCSCNQFLQKAELGWRRDIDQTEASQSGDVNFIDPAEDFLGEEVKE